MSHEVESMAWAHEVPWHGLGNRVEGSVSIDEMLKAAGLDWEVRQESCWVEIEGQKVNVGRKALYRSSDKKILTVTGDNWKPVQNREVLEFFREYTETGGATLETAGSLRGGQIIWGLARVLNSSFTISGNDHVKGYILMVSPHILGKASTVRKTAVRVVCANTLAAAGGVDGKNAEYRQSHIKPFDIRAARETVQEVFEQMAQLKLEAEALQSLKLSEYDTVRVLADFFQPEEEPKKMNAKTDALSDKEKARLAFLSLKSEERVKALINDPALQNSAMQGVLWAVAKAPGAVAGNGWGVLNGVTYWADHMAGRESDARLFNSWLGNTGAQKQAVKEKLLQMV